ncbi:MAG: hypothetical protein R6V48_08055, partial [Fidelibacterota bacterium]
MGRVAWGVWRLACGMGRVAFGVWRLACGMGNIQNNNCLNNSTFLFLFLFSLLRQGYVGQGK